MSETKYNHRQLKRLKNKLWRMYKRDYLINRRIRTHLFASPPSSDAATIDWINADLYEEFQKVWREWKQKSVHVLPQLLKVFPVYVIYQTFKIIRRNNVRAHRAM